MRTEFETRSTQAAIGDRLSLVYNFGLEGTLH